MKRVVLLCGACIAVLASSASASSGSRIPLPSRADAAPLSGAQSVFGPPPGQFPSKAPGRIGDDESVQVSLDASGSVSGIAVDQTLRVTGVGDFTLEITGPASEVRAAPGADLQPGLRNGSVIWEGFSPGARTLRATVTIDVSRPRFLGPPLRISVRMLQDGQVVTPPVHGAVVAEIRIENATDGARAMHLGDADVTSLRDVSMRTRAALVRGRAPYAGEAGIAASVPARGIVRTGSANVQVPMAVHGTISFGGATRALSALLPSIDHPDGSMVVRLDARDIAAAPVISLHAEAALPDPRSLAASLPVPDALRRLQVALWQVVRMPEYEAFLGSPLPASGSARFTFTTAPPLAIVRPAPHRSERAHPWRIGIAVAFLIAIAAGATRVWQRN